MTAATRVEKESTAEKAGLKPGDTIVEVNGEVISDTNGLMEKLEPFNAGDKVTVTVWRPDRVTDAGRGRISVSGQYVENIEVGLELLDGVARDDEHNYEMAANSTGLPVITGPVEGTAIGNIMLQAKAAGLVGDMFEMRRIIADSIEIAEYQPQDRELWDAAYRKYLKVISL